MSRRFTIGRDKDRDVPIFDDSVSRLHAEIWLADDGSLMMADRGSVNGTTVVRGKLKFPLAQDVVLPGDYIRMGSVMLSVGEIVEAIEAKTPGALTPRAALGGAAQPASLPPPPPMIAPAPALAAPPPPIPMPQAGPVPPRPQGGQLIRCACGAVKAIGQLCPACHQ